MSFLKAAVSVAAVAGVGFLGYKICKSKKVRKAAAIAVQVMAAPSPAPRPTYHEPVRPVATVVVTETETSVKADKSKMEGVMGVAAHVKAQPVKVHVRASARTTEIEVERTTAAKLKPLSDKEMENKFGFSGATLPQ